MKKVFGLLMIMCSVVLLTGCAKEEVNENDSRKIYAKCYVEEVGDTSVDVTNVVIFNDDKTGTLAMQDIVPFVYDYDTIRDMEGNVIYNYSINGYVLTLEDGTLIQEFTQADETILENIPELAE